MAKADAQRHQMTILDKDRERATLLHQNALLQANGSTLQTEHTNLRQAHANLQRDAATAARADRNRVSAAEAALANAFQASRASAAANTIQFPVASQVRCQHGAA